MGKGSGEGSTWGDIATIGGAVIGGIAGAGAGPLGIAGGAALGSQLGSKFGGGTTDSGLGKTADFIKTGTGISSIAGGGLSALGGMGSAGTVAGTASNAGTAATTGIKGSTGASLLMPKAGTSGADAIAGFAGSEKSGMGMMDKLSDIIKMKDSLGALLGHSESNPNPSVILPPADTNITPQNPMMPLPQMNQVIAAQLMNPASQNRLAFRRFV